METSKVLWQMICCLILVSGVPDALSQGRPAQPVPDTSSVITSSVIEEPAPLRGAVNQQSSPSAAELPDSPSSTISKLRAAGQRDSGQQLDEPALTTQALAGQDQEPEQLPLSPPQPSPLMTSTSQSSPVSSTEKPVGTAAAGVIPATGIAASQPAGVAIAPAKQRRVRTMVLKMGAIIGAGVAIGSVVALTEATPSKPPGAH